MNPERVEHFALPLEWAKYAPLDVVLRVSDSAFIGPIPEGRGMVRAYFGIDAGFGYDLIVPEDLAHRTIRYISDNFERLAEGLGELETLRPFRRDDGVLVTVEDCHGYADACGLSPLDPPDSSSWVPTAYVSPPSEPLRKCRHRFDIEYFFADAMDTADIVVEWLRGAFRLFKPRPKRAWAPR